jgi:hypothetical protein
LLPTCLIKIVSRELTYAWFDKLLIYQKLMTIQVQAI